MTKHYLRHTATLVAVLLSVSSLLASCGEEKDILDPLGEGTHAQTHTQAGTNAEASDAVTDGVVTTPAGEQLEVSTGSPAQTVTPETQPQESETVKEPSEGEYVQTSETTVVLGDSITVSGTGASVDGKTVTITHAGTYLVSGSMADGQIIVDTTDESKVVLILNGVSLSCSDGPAVFVKSAPKRVEIRTAANSVNILSDGTGYIVADENQTEGNIYPNACIYSCEDLRFDGEGELHVNGNADKGINTKDDLDIRGGTMVITSVGVGMRGNDSVMVSGGTVTVNAGGDGVKTANTETEGKGQILMENGTLYITAKGDGLSAATDLTVSGGNLVLTTTDTDGEVLKESTGNSTGSTGGGFGRPGGMMGESSADKASISAKGLKALKTLTVSGGKITIVAQDDGIHSDTDVYITDGSVHIRAADDGIHAEKELVISGGVLTVAQSFEGLEALHITVMGGTNRITASDDGANATNGEGGGFGGGGGFPGGGFPGGGGGGRPRSGSTVAVAETTDNTPLLKFAGGYTVINAGGDGIDSNGNIDITGGTVIVYGPTDSMNGPIDSGDGGYSVTVSGGLLLAVGSNGMAETAENNGQAVLAASWRSGGLSAGETIGIVDSNGKVLAAFKLPKAIQSIVFSCADLVSGQSYSVVGGGSFTGEATDGVIDPATYTGYESMGEIQTY